MLAGMKRLALVLLAAACSSKSNTTSIDAPPQGSGSGSAIPDAAVAASLSSIKTVVVLYAENRAFDNVYGSFPGANGLPVNGAYIPQLDRDGSQLATLPQTWTGVTAAGQTPVVTQMMSANLANSPYSIESTYPGVDKTVITRDLYHRFFENQMQIDGGANDMFAAWADSGGLVMGHYDGSSMALWQLAAQNTLADNWFMGAFGGSFLNHQYLICACAPEYPDADTAAAKPTIAILDDNGNGGFLPELTLGSANPASALDGPPTYALSGNIVPKNYFGDATFRAVNTMQPPYQPSSTPAAADDMTGLYVDPSNATTLPAQTEMTIGDQLDAASVTWAWYSGAWDTTVMQAADDHAALETFPPPGAVPDFQFHHQPFNYYATLDPVMHPEYRAAHLKDETDLISEAAAGTLPQVVFYKPEGDLNQHAGYASVDAGDQHIADLVKMLQASPQYPNMLIVVTYDENGGWWDHVAPPVGDLMGPGTRIPAIIVSPFAKKGFVDHTQYDTGSIQRFIDLRFGIAPLPGITSRDAALVAAGGVAMGDLTNALDF
jgi:acid phosphatase